MNPTTPPALAPGQAAHPAADAPGAGVAAGPGTRPTAAAGQATRGDDGQQPLARLLQRLGLGCTHPWRATAVELLVYTGVALAGGVLRLLAGLPAVTAVSLVAAAVVLAELLPAPHRRARPQPPAPTWVAAAQAAEAGLGAGWLAAERASLACFAARTGHRGAFMHVAACQPEARYPGLCRSALVYAQHGYLLAVLGEHVQPVAAVTLSHELAHLSVWRQRLASAVLPARLAGWLLAGWVATGPWLLTAVAIVQGVTMLALWTAEAGCDRQAAREHGTVAVIIALGSGWGIHPRESRWERRVISGLRYLTGLTRHPPIWVRRLLLGVLAPPSRPQRPAGSGSGSTP